MSMLSTHTNKGEKKKKNKDVMCSERTVTENGETGVLKVIFQNCHGQVPDMERA